jgi:hypothetical protein
MIWTTGLLTSGLLALREWNNAWAAAAPIAYDLECDIAFKGDPALGINIAGRHRFDWASSWHQVGACQVGVPETVDKAITGHERAFDFMVTWFQHVTGPMRPVAAFLAPD